ncbi:ARM repeat-containing protein [Marasmius fiardii PR-910]|nr:ARM repeat-containing protein [Marasmius fiardii PR-910]
MDVPFVSSGASSRAHYVLVRKVEEESSFIKADQHLSEAVDITLRDLSSSQLSLKKCKEHLITLLYCYTTASAGALERDALHDALSYAITLAEAGGTVADKRIGYLFCSEMMPPGHELQLMLVNTLRKDLESPQVPRICLALDHLISSPSEEVIPAIRSRLMDLLVHNSPLIRRRTLLTFKAFSYHSPDLLVPIVALLVRRLKDSDQSVLNAALSVATRTFELHKSTRLDICGAVNKLLVSAFSQKTNVGRKKTGSGDVKVLNTAKTVGVSDNNLPLIGDIIQLATKHKKDALLQEAFLTLLSLGPETSLLTSRKLSPINYVRHLLTSQDLNDQYLFLTCLESVDPKFWAGTTPDIPAVLDQWEVEHIMRLLDSRDPLVRKMTVRILNRVDNNVVGSYYTRSLRQMPPGLSSAYKTEYVCRLLEIIEIDSQGDGEQYAREVQEVLQHVYSVTTEDKEAVLEVVVENVLSHIRIASADWQIQCATTFLARSLELEDAAADPTMTVILSALACEYIIRVSLSPHDLLRKMSSQLVSSPLPVQEACLLAMLRVAAECDHIPENILNIVSKVGEGGGRKLRLFSSKFHDLVQDRSSLGIVVRKAKSSALPDFLRSLQSNTKPESQNHSSPPNQSPSQKSDRLPASLKLRYSAYVPPSATPRLKSRSLSQGSERESRMRSPNLIAGLKALTGGDLAIAASSEEFEMSMMKPGPPRVDMSTAAKPTETGCKKEGFIALDSPFVPDSGVEGDINIENAWNSLDQSSNSRGWYDGTIDSVVKQIAALSTVGMRVVETMVPPYEGELKVLVFSTGQTGELQSLGAILRLRASEEETCLWRLRGKQPVYETVKDLLTH